MTDQNGGWVMSEIDELLYAISAILTNTPGAMRLLLISDAKTLYEREARWDFDNCDECLRQLGELGLIEIKFGQIEITPRGIMITNMLKKAMNLGLVNLGLARE